MARTRPFLRSSLPIALEAVPLVGNVQEVETQVLKPTRTQQVVRENCGHDGKNDYRDVCQRQRSTKQVDKQDNAGIGK